MQCPADSDPRSREGGHVLSTGTDVLSPSVLTQRRIENGSQIEDQQ
jgi:hypothetical protein